MPLIDLRAPPQVKTHFWQAIEAQVKSLLDSGSCSRVSGGCNCGDDARGFYRVFDYRGNTVVVASGAPDHRAEHDAPRQNPNTRCESGVRKCQIF